MTQKKLTQAQQVVDVLRKKADMPRLAICIEW